MTPDQVDGHQGRGRVERLCPVERTDEALAERFRVFAREECSGESGLNVISPTYELLSLAIADNPRLLAMARECMVGQPIPNLFFAAVKRLLDDREGDGLARHYALIATGEPPGDGLPDSFARFCFARESEIVDLVRTRRVQTNEIRRCSYLMPAFRSGLDRFGWNASRSDRRGRERRTKPIVGQLQVPIFGQLEVRAR